jgi:hypothetical protein
LPGLTRQSMLQLGLRTLRRGTRLLRVSMDARVKPAHDEF